MNLLMGIHIAAGIVALGAGTLAVAGRKGGAMHARAGTWFFAAMLVLVVPWGHAWRRYFGTTRARVEAHAG